MWSVEEFESAETLDGVRLTTPNHFTFTLEQAKRDAVRVLADLVKEEEHLLLPDGQTLFFGPEDGLYVLEADVWINKDFEYKDLVCTRAQLASFIRLYLDSRWEDERL